MAHAENVASTRESQSIEPAGKVFGNPSPEIIPVVGGVRSALGANINGVAVEVASKPCNQRCVYVRMQASGVGNNEWAARTAKIVGFGNDAVGRGHVMDSFRKRKFVERRRHGVPS